MFFRRFQIPNTIFSIRHKSEKALQVKSLKFWEYGKASEVVEICDDQLRKTEPQEVLVKVLAAPIHPVDIDQVLGPKPGPKLREKTTENVLPLIPGKECVGEVIDVGSDVKDLKVGERVVVPYVEGRGTWTTHAVYNDYDLTVVPKDLPIESAALLTVNPCAAYRILKDFIALKPGDCVLLNGSTSALGQAVIQLCKAFSFFSIGLVRERPDIDAAKDYVKKLGATEVLTLEELNQATFFETGYIPKPRLTLSCVARTSSKELGKFLDQNGVMVSYGCMSGQPVATATSAFVHKDFVQRPFWMARWNRYNPDIGERRKMLGKLTQLVQDKSFKPPETKLVPFEDYKKALECAENFKGYTAKKFILDMRCD